jgi:hypothetical protein
VPEPEEPDWEGMARAMDNIVDVLNTVRKRLLAEGFSPGAAERITVAIFTKVWGGP